MSDKELEHYDYVLDTVERKIIEESQRAPIDVPIEMRGLGPKDTYNQILAPEDQFQDVL